MKRYGLIGEKLSHSFSKPIHEELTGEPYTIIPLSREEFPRFMEQREFDGINVTIPYKQEVIPYCAVVDNRVERIGAVNTIVNDDGLLRGYNTDYDGFSRLLDANGFCVEGKRALILGSGGTSRTVRTVLADRGAADIQVASRTPGQGEISYPDALKQTDMELIVNTTPVGMHPHTEGQAIHLSSFPRLSTVVDVIYNPLRTRLLQQAETLGIPHANGLLMLVSQARAAAERFRGICLPDGREEQIFKALLSQKQNIVLTGMPVSGKSTLGQRLSGLLHREFADVDAEIVREAGMEIPEIFTRLGETGFRKLEQEAVRALSRKNGLVISTGGGTILEPENIRELRLNGVILFIDRPLSLLPVGKGRPLAKSPEEVAALYERRYPLYLSRCDRRVVNDVEPETVLNRLLMAIADFNKTKPGFIE